MDIMYPWTAGMQWTGIDFIATIPGARLLAVRAPQLCVASCSAEYSAEYARDAVSVSLK